VTVTSEQRRLSRRDAVLLWFGVLAPPAAWSLHFALGYLFDEAACMNNTGVGSVEPLIAVSTVVFGSISILGGLAAYAILRMVRRGDLLDPRGRLLFMAVASLLGAMLFTALSVLEGVQIVSFSACRPG
jgi:hypothetical protein